MTASREPQRKNGKSIMSDRHIRARTSATCEEIVGDRAVRLPNTPDARETNALPGRGEETTPIGARRGES